MGAIFKIRCKNCGYDVEASLGEGGGFLYRSGLFGHLEQEISICSKCGAVEKNASEKCKKCGGDTKIFDERSIRDAICPKCHEKIDAQIVGVWD